MDDRAPWLHQDPSFTHPPYVHGWTDDMGPDFKSPPRSQAMERAVQELSSQLDLEMAAWADQVHGGTVVRAQKEGLQGKADAIFTDRPGLALVGRSADCPLVLLCCDDEAGRPLVGMAHASWRSTLEEITAQLLATMVRAGALASTCRALICPSAGPCCYEVGPEVKSKFRSRFGAGVEQSFRLVRGKLHLDLWQANVAQLEAAGVPEKNIRLQGHCTICGRPGQDLIYPSYRRQGSSAGRFAAAIGILKVSG